MDNVMKRRVFLGSAVGALVAAPLAIKYLTGDKAGVTNRNFNRELQAYRNMVDVPIQTIDGPATFTLPLRPPVGQGWTYLFFAPSVMPNEISTAPPGEPDVFNVRKGWLGVGRTQSDQIVFVGGDEENKEYSPRWTTPKESSEIALMFQDGKLFPAKEKGTAAQSNRDTQFEHLLGLNVPAGDLSIGRQWRASTGRILPFRYATTYQIAGFAEVATCKTVNVRFDATVPNMAPGMTLERGQSLTNKHSGNVYFDLETGMLVRQEVAMTSTVTGIKGTDKDLVVEGKFIIQLFPA